MCRMKTSPIAAPSHGVPLRPLLLPLQASRRPPLSSAFAQLCSLLKPAGKRKPCCNHTRNCSPAVVCIESVFPVGSLQLSPSSGSGAGKEEGGREAPGVPWRHLSNQRTVKGQGQGSCPVSQVAPLTAGAAR